MIFFSSLPRGKWLDRPDREKPKFGFGRSLWPNLRSSSALVANATGHITHKVPIKDKITFRVVVLAKTLPKSNWLHKVHVNVKQINTVSYYKNNFARFPSWFIFWQWRVLLCTFPRKIMRKLRFYTCCTLYNLVHKSIQRTNTENLLVIQWIFLITVIIAQCSFAC